MALLIGDDTIPQTVEAEVAGQDAGLHTSPDHVVTAPLWLYVGKKNAPVVEQALPSGIDPGNASFLNRNGLLAGQLYYFVADHGVRTVAQFNGTGSTLTGVWKEIDVLDRTKAGEKGYDPLGYKTGLTLRREAKAGGAFQFSRPEDVSTHPAIGTRAVLASTGRDTVFPDHDAWGTIYRIDVDFETMTATLKILYDGDDASGARFSHPDEGIRNPDNLEWGEDGWLYIQEDKAKQQDPLFGSHSSEESSLWRLDPLTDEVQRIARIDRSVILPKGSTDESPGVIGVWESAGILDVTHLFVTRVEGTSAAGHGPGAHDTRRPDRKAQAGRRWPTHTAQAAVCGIFRTGRQVNDRMIPSTGVSSWNVGQYLGVATILLVSSVAGLAGAARENTNPAPPPELEPHLAAIARIGSTISHGEDSRRVVPHGHGSQRR